MMNDFRSIFTPDAVLIYASRAKLILLLLAAAAFVTLSPLLWKTGRTDYRIVAVLAVTLCGAAALWLLARLIWQKPALIISSIGIYDGSSALGGIVLRWEQIEDVYISFLKTSAFSKQRFLSVRVKDTDEFLREVAGMKAMTMRMNIGLVGAPVNIPATTLSIPLEEVIEHMRKTCPSVRVIGQAAGKW
jgi:hypothetical protein